MKTRKNLLIFGSGTLAELATFYFEKDSNYKVISYVEDDTFEGTKKELMGSPIILWSDALERYSIADVDFFVSIGYRKTNDVRKQRYQQVKSAGYSCASYVSSKAINFAQSIGDNCFILENNVLQPFTVIGNNVTMWSGNHLGHHTLVEDNVFISSHAVISGKCRIGMNSFLGVNCSLHDGTVIGEKSVIGAGAIVSKSCDARSVFAPNSTLPRIIKRDVI